MAKKKRRSPKKKQEEEYEFIPPEFDEKEFLETDIYTTKVLMITVVLAIILGVFGFFLHQMVDVIAGYVLLLASIGALGTILQIFNVDVSQIERKTMIGNYLTFFFLYLATWIIALNPPFGS